jgi:ATP-dependent Clp endopeptidase proteolytic subunit ClpP
MKQMVTRKKKNLEEEHVNEELEELEEDPVFIQEMNLISLYGDVNEKRGKEIVLSLFHFRDQVVRLPQHFTAKLKGKNDALLAEVIDKINQPLDFLVSTHGGSASDMFSIYDTMNLVKKDIKIRTLGMGKVMSAGVLLMATGTKGLREIGQNCRVMIHPVQAGAMGGIHDIENEFQEISMMQEMYIEALAKETKMKTARIKKLIDEKRNIYISAEEAISYGIADKIAE